MKNKLIDEWSQKEINKIIKNLNKLGIKASTGRSMKGVPKWKKKN
jgi:hypothetical protein